MQHIQKRKPHNKFIFEDELYRKVCLSSEFDGGNLQKAQLVTDQEKKEFQSQLTHIFQIVPCIEPFNPQCSIKPSAKTFFNFSITILRSHPSKQGSREKRSRYKGSEKNASQKMEDDSENQRNQEDFTDLNFNKGQDQKGKNLSQNSQNLLKGDEEQDGQMISEWKQEVEYPWKGLGQIQDQCQEFDDNLMIESSGMKLSEGMQAISRSEHEQKQSVVVLNIGFLIRRFNLPPNIDKNIFLQYYRPCIGKITEKQNQIEYQKFLPSNMQIIRQNDGSFSLRFTHSCTFQFPQKVEGLQQESSPIFLAYHYPYSNAKLDMYLQELQSSIKSANQNIFSKKSLKEFLYFKKQTLILSVQKRPVQLLTLTAINDSEFLSKLQENFGINELKSYDEVLQNFYEREPRISNSLFPFLETQKRSFKFKKPYIMISCRVHPGQTSASFALEGLLNKLVDRSPESQFLLKSFTFQIIPILNTDGVFHGTYRMDPLGQNLNRFYDVSHPQKQPSIFAAQTLLQYYSQTENTLQAFFDFHSHAQLIGPFIYGNAYQKIAEQTQTQIFCRILQKNNEDFLQKNCGFTQKNMNSKDSLQIMSKNGSARLCAFRMMKNNVHCYTLEIGHLGYKMQFNSDGSSKNFKKILSKSASKSEQPNNKIFSIKDYQSIGASVIETLSEVYLLSLASFCQATEETDKRLILLKQMRISLSKEIINREQRFKIKQSNLAVKIKQIDNQIGVSIYGKILNRYPIIEAHMNKFFVMTEKQSFLTKNLRKYCIKTDSANKQSGLSSKLSQNKTINLKDTENNNQDVEQFSINMLEEGKTPQTTPKKQKSLHKKRSLKIKKINSTQDKSLPNEPPHPIHKMNKTFTISKKQKFTSLVHKDRISTPLPIEEDTPFFGAIGRSQTYSLEKNSLLIQELEKPRKKSFEESSKLFVRKQIEAISKVSQRETLQAKRCSFGFVFGDNGLEETESTRLEEARKMYENYSTIETQLNMNTGWNNQNAFLPKLSLIKGQQKSKVLYNLSTLSRKRQQLPLSSNSNNFGVSRLNITSKSQRK